MSPAPDHRLNIDTHAHIAPDVTPAQVDALGHSLVVAMTRSIDEARYVARRRDTKLIWSLGTHPGVADALAQYDELTFRRAIDHFAVVGEVGLDRRGSSEQQGAVFTSVLDVCTDQPVLISVHSTGRVRQTLDIIAERPHPGLILHWFTGTSAEVAEAVALGCHFSVNAAMPQEVIQAIPINRMLAETDFPSSRPKTRAKKPGDVAAVLELIGATRRHDDPRSQLQTNFTRLLRTTGAIERLAPATRSLLLG